MAVYARDGLVDSELVADQNDWAFRVYVNLLIKSDKAGRADGRPRSLRSLLFPLGTSHRLEEIQVAIDELHTAKLLFKYDFDDKPFIQVAKVQKSGSEKNSYFPWIDGSFAIRYAKIPARGFKGDDTEFVHSSLPDAWGAEGVDRGFDKEKEEDQVQVREKEKDSPASSEGKDPANELARVTGMGQNTNDEIRGLLRRLIAINGFEHARGALETSIAKLGPGKAAVQYAKGIVNGEVSERGKGTPNGKPRSSVAIRRDE